jgi:uncharacterized protein YyaL (SSP411 family)
MSDRNLLKEALSPYLLQHADNPVHWLEWNDETLALARKLGRPILLSIGYSACHWCHVMAHECFEDEAIAGLMNAHFVNIKVDREERPDLDRIYQLAHQLLTGRGGGWPLNVFLDPDSQAPFFAGTYFPPEPRSGMIAFPDLLGRIHQVWSERRDELREQHLQVQQALKAISQPRPPEGDGSLESLAESAVAQAATRYDDRHGGFGEGAKFPQAPLLGLLAARRDDDQASQMLDDTLKAMARYGLRDHLGGGFFRYCVDPAWEIPHFEKMLADNALLLDLYSQAARRWQRPDHVEVCAGIVDWLQREMQLEGGGLAASLDADSEGSEGASYLWRPEQVATTLDADDARLFNARYGLDGPANFEGRWHLLEARDLDELTAQDQDREVISSRLEQARLTLLKQRARRPQPGRDDKLIGSWNGLAIEGLARAGLERPELQAWAAECLDAVAVRLFGQEPPRSVWRNGKSAQLANLEDHAGVLLACLELLQWRFESRWFNLARRIARRIDRQFVDDESGASYLTALEHETLLTRPLAFSDDATPGGAGLAILGLSSLGHLCGDAGMLRLARFMLQAGLGDMAASPMGHAGLIRAGLELENPPVQILLGGETPATAAWHAALSARANVHVYRVDPGTALEEPPALIQGIQALKQPTAIVCTGLQCLAPAHDPDHLEQQLAEVASDRT